MQIEERAPSPEAVLVKASQENLGPSDEADAEFAKELAKLVTDSSAESKRVDRKTALALWESTVLPGGVRKKRAEETDDEGESSSSPTEEQVMKFTLITKKGKQQQVGTLYVLSWALAQNSTVTSIGCTCRVSSSYSNAHSSVAR